MAEFVTVTLNPAIDVSATVERIAPFHKLRCTSALRDPGGGGINVARADETDSGDAWTVTPVAPGMVAALLVDGLGHGPAAAAAAGAALASFAQQPTHDLNLLVQRAHDAMQPTRGGVLGAAIIDRDQDETTFLGIGNVTACVASHGTTAYLPSRDGTLGGHLSAPRGRAVRTRWEPKATLILASDGIRGHWDLASYPGLLDHDPAVVAATLHRDHERGTDDVAVVVVHDLRGNP